MNDLLPEQLVCLDLIAIYELFFFFLFFRCNLSGKYGFVQLVSPDHVQRHYTYVEDLVGSQEFDVHSIGSVDELLEGGLDDDSIGRRDALSECSDLSWNIIL